MLGNQVGNQTNFRIQDWGKGAPKYLTFLKAAFFACTCIAGSLFMPDPQICTLTFTLPQFTTIHAQRKHVTPQSKCMSESEA